MIDEHIRRIIAVDAHRRRAGKCPTRIYALGCGESSDIVPRADGFVDTDTGLSARCEPMRIVIGGSRVIEISLDGDVGFSAVDSMNGARLRGRAGGGTSVTLYDGEERFFQYAVVTPDQPLATLDVTPASAA